MTRRSTTPEPGDAAYTSALDFVEVCPICEKDSDQPVMMNDVFIGRRKHGGVTAHVTETAIHLHHVALIDRATWSTWGLVVELMSRLVRVTGFGSTLGVAPIKSYRVYDDGSYEEERA